MWNWRIGDKCLAPYYGDGELYKAVIQGLRDGEATVKYFDYTSDENETVAVSELKKHVEAKKSFVSPLRYQPEETRLRNKYAELDPELSVSPCDSSRSTLTPGTSESPYEHGKVRRERKQVVAMGGQEKIVSREGSGNKERTSLNSSESEEKISSTTSSIKRSARTAVLDGFTSEELEKPHFPGIKSDAGLKVPYLLSEGDVTPAIEIPSPMNRYLRDYQREGVRFLYQHFILGRGAILADDMGLGKTIQVLAFISAILHKKGTKDDSQRSLPLFLREGSVNAATDPGVFLIVCPNSVLYNWLEEIDTWTYCTVGKYHGRERDEVLQKALRGRLDIVLTTFETYRMKLDSLLEVSWSAIIVDEVHKIKESSSQITVALKRINTTRRYGLTGTALQNKIGELWCVLDWANPECLGSWKEFKRKYEAVITKGQKYDASKRELAAGRKAALEFSRLRDNWLLRRTKSLISEQLPKKDEKVVFCHLTDLQKSVSKALLDSDEMKLVLTQHDPCDCGKGTMRGKCHYKRTSEGLTIKSLTFSLMSALIKAANHAALLDPGSKTSSPLQQRLLERISRVAFAGHPKFVSLCKEARFTTLSDPQYCGKMMVLSRLLNIFKEEGSKVLLFSFYTKLLDILELYVQTTGYTYYRLDGKTPATERQRLVGAFNRDPGVFLFLISTKAGGMGLNLTGANVVVIFDPNWNPMYDLQAQDRAYRIGQHRDVRVYRLISTGCIEENMYLRQVYKQQLASVAMTTENAKRYFTAVAGETDGKGELFGLQNMFTLRTEGSCLTRDLIQREVKTEKGIQMAKYIPPKRVDPLDLSRETDSEHLEADSGSDGSGDQATSLPFESSSDHVSPPDCGSSSTEGPAGSHMVQRKMSKKRRAPPLQQSGSSESEGETNTVASNDRKGKSITKGGTVMSEAKRSKPVCAHVDSAQSASSGSMVKHRPGDWDYTEVRAYSSGNAEKTVFSECGVAYVHSNLNVVGASTVEDHVSKTALCDVFENKQFSQEPAFCRVPILRKDSSSESDDVGLNEESSLRISGSMLRESTDLKVDSVEVERFSSITGTHHEEDTTVFVGQTPLGIRKDQFKDIAKVLNYPSVESLAASLVHSDEKDLLNISIRYYRIKYPHLPCEEYLKKKEKQTHSTRKKKSVAKNSERMTKGLSDSARKFTKRRGAGGVTFDSYDSMSDEECHHKQSKTSMIESEVRGVGEVPKKEIIKCSRRLDQGDHEVDFHSIDTGHLDGKPLIQEANHSDSKQTCENVDNYKNTEQDILPSSRENICKTAGTKRCSNVARSRGMNFQSKVGQLNNKLVSRRKPHVTEKIGPKDLVTSHSLVTLIHNQRTQKTESLMDMDSDHGMETIDKETARISQQRTDTSEWTGNEFDRLEKLKVSFNEGDSHPAATDSVKDHLSEKTGSRTSTETDTEPDRLGILSKISIDNEEGELCNISASRGFQSSTSCEEGRNSDCEVRGSASGVGLKTTRDLSTGLAMDRTRCERKHSGDTSNSEEELGLNPDMKSNATMSVLDDIFFSSQRARPVKPPPKNRRLDRVDASKY